MNIFRSPWNLKKSGKNSEIELIFKGFLGNNDF